MTVTLTENRWSYTGTGSLTGFAYANRIFAGVDLKVFVDGSPKALGTDYSVSGVGNAGGGNVVFVTAPADGAAVTIVRDVAARQELDFAALGSFPAEENEKALDRLTVLVQQLEDSAVRTLRQPDSDMAGIASLPVKTARAGKALGFDAEGNPAVSGSSLASIDTILSSAQARADEAAASATAASGSATAASTSATAASASATSAGSSAGSAGAAASSASASAAGAEAASLSAAQSASALGFRWNIDGTTTLGDPGTGNLRFNHAAPASVTALALSATTLDAGGPDVSDWIASWDGSSMLAQRGTLTLRRIGAPQVFALYTVNGAIADNGAWLQIPVALAAGAGSLAAGDDVMLAFSRTGDAGSLDISSLAEETEIDPQTDFLPLYDSSAGVNRKVKPKTLAGDPAISVQSGDFTAGASQSNTLYVVSPASSSADCTLPAASGVADGFRLAVKNNSDGRSVVVQRAGADTIDGAASIRVPGRDVVELVRTGSSAWSIARGPAHPVGATLEWTKDTLPPGGWAWCNGVALSRTTWQGLFNEIGTTYGAGDGSTTFNPPDRRGRVAAGKDDMGGASAANRLTTGGSGIDAITLGASGGSETHSLTGAQNGQHSHNQTSYKNNSGSGALYGAIDTNGSNPTAAGEPATTNSGNGDPHNNTQPTMITNFIIKT